MVSTAPQTPSPELAPELDRAVVERLDRARATIHGAAQAVGREPSGITLIAVSKGQSAAAIAKLIAAGQLVFGENRVQEGQAKWPDLRQRHPGLELHLIGPLQTNKLRDAMALFDVIQSLDRPKLADALAAQLARGGRQPGLFIQVNIGEEPQKSGVLPKDAAGFIAYCRDEKKLEIRGLMGIPPLLGDPAPHFARLRELALDNGLMQLSMGMSADYATAVKLGATHVRVGTALFGARPAAKSPARP